MKLYEDQVFTSQDFIFQPLPMGAYEYCTFKQCDFSKDNLSEMRFMECTFNECDFSNASVQNTSIQDVIFQSCKMLGIQFEEVNSFNFSASFDQCNLQHCTFYEMDMRKMKFKQCSFAEADFISADCQGLVFDLCDFTRAHFEETNLENTDFTTSINYQISPLNNQLKGAMFSKDGVEGLLKVFGVVIKE